MQGLVTMIAASAVLSAGLVAGLAATDAAARPKPATAATATPEIDPSKVVVSGRDAARAASGDGSTRDTRGSEGATTTCAAAVWPYLPAGCAAEGRKVRIIALTGR